MEKRLLEIYELVGSSSRNNSYTIILDESEGKRRLPIVIGSSEARAIAVGMGGVESKRPYTHDLMLSIFKQFNVELVEVDINKFMEGVFYASLICMKENGEEVEIDSRTSDAIALAVRFNCPIYAYENVLDSAGIVFEAQFEQEAVDDGELEEAVISLLADDPSSSMKKDSFDRYTLEELKNMLNEALESEDYEKAALIRDEIEKR